MPNGTVKWFNPQKGYGFIAPDTGDKDVFVHINAVEGSGMRRLTEGQTIAFDIEVSGGKRAAVRLRAASTSYAVDKEYIGEVVDLTVRRGFGFLQTQGAKDKIFFHYSAMPPLNWNQIDLGQQFRFRVATRDSKLLATDLRPLA